MGIYILYCHGVNILVGTHTIRYIHHLIYAKQNVLKLCTFVIR